MKQKRFYMGEIHSSIDTSNRVNHTYHDPNHCLGFPLTQEGFDFYNCRELFDYKNRTLYILEEITDKVSWEIVSWIMRINIEDRGKTERVPIKIFINSPGGDVDCGMAIVNAIENSVTPIYTINAGYCCSMAFHIFISGHKRFAYKNAVFLHHDGVSILAGTTLKNEDHSEFSKKYRERVFDPNVLNHTKIPRDILEAKTRCEWYMLADEETRLTYGVFDAYFEGNTIEQLFGTD